MSEKTPTLEQEKDELEIAEQSSTKSDEVTEQIEASTKKKRKTRASKKPKKELTPEEIEEKEKLAEKKKKNKPKNVKQAAKRLISYITERKIGLVMVAILVVLTTVVSAIAGLLMLPIYEILEDVTLGTVVDGDAAFAEITTWLIYLSLSYIVAAALSFSYTRIMLSVSSRTLASLRRDLFNHIQGLSIDFFDKNKTGDIMSRFTSDVNRVNDLVNNSFTTIISSTISAILTITLMVVMSWQITLTLTFSVILILLVVLIITRKCSPLYKEQQRAMGECNAYVEEYIKGVKAVKLFCYEDISKKNFRDLNEHYRLTGVKANIIGGFMSPIMSMISRLNYAVSVVFGTWLVLAGKMSVPTLVTYLGYAKSYGTPIISIASCYSTMISALAGAERIFEILDIENETDEGKVELVKALKNYMGEDIEDENGLLHWKVPTDSGFKYVPLKGDIEVKDVTFSYIEGTEVLKNIDVHAKSGQKVAFVGSTGAGKTTITNLVNRFYEVDNGEILYDGIPIKDIKKDDLRSSMAMVLQDTRLFLGTIADHIRYGKLDATDEEVIQAAKIANAHSFIEKLPDGYDTEIRADGVNISTGQAQLINIARAAIANAPLLILDEATSSVDTRTERLIELGMNQLMENKTVLVIAHRLSTVRNSEEIIVLEQGEIIEQGAHQELIDLGKKYYQLYTGIFELS